MMADDQPTEAFSLLSFDRPEFDVAMRGYDRRQVQDHIERMDSDLASAASERDAAMARSADLAAQLASAYAEVESLRRKIRTDVSTVVTAENVSDRIRTMLELAEEEAARLREEAQLYADQTRRSTDEDVARVRSEARAESERLMGMAQIRVGDVESAYQARISEGDAYLAEQRAMAASELRTGRAQLDAEVEAANAERTRLDAEHEATRDGLDAEHEAARAQLDTQAQEHRDTATEDFEIALRARRRAEQETASRERSEAEASNNELMAGARAEATELVRAAALEARRLEEARQATTHRLRLLRDGVAALIDPDPDPSPVDGQ
jgi:cell division septum initiation protein DivIVA